MYYGDSLNCRVQKFTSEGQFLGEWGSCGAGEGQFHKHPRAGMGGYLIMGIVVDTEGNVYVVDVGNDRVQKFSNEGSFLTSFGGYGHGDGQFEHPNGIAIDGSGHVYVGDFERRKILKFTSDGEFVSSWGAADHVTGVGADSQGRIYVANHYRCRIQVFDAEGNFLGKWGKEGGGEGEFLAPTGITIDDKGHVYVAEMGRHRVQVFKVEFP